MKNLLIGFSAFLFLTIYSCKPPANGIDKKITAPELDEQPVRNIEIEHPFLALNPEFSGLAWYKDKLILLPQYPNSFTKGSGYLFYLSKNEITNYLYDDNPEPLKLHTIKFNDTGLEKYASIGSGYEAVVFEGDHVYLSIESIDNFKTTGFLVKGELNFEKKIIDVNSENLGKIKSQSGIHNFSDETILSYQGRIYTIHEANGMGANPHPHSKVFNYSLNQTGSVNFPNVEYRITDATEPDSAGIFYALNYLYLGDINKLKPETDSIAVKYGLGKTQGLAKGVERIIKFRIIENEIILEENQTPVYLELIGEGRNWEGIVKLDKKGFLIITDKYPETILAFVPGNI